MAIDSSLLGGMYGGRIAIIATDKGAGVHMSGQMAANADAMTIRGDGKLVLGEVRAKKALTANSRSDAVQVKGALFSDHAVALGGKRGVALDDGARVAAAGAVSLAGKTVSLGKAALVASGVDEDGHQAARGALTVTAERLVAGAGQLAAGEALTVNAAVIDLDRAVDDGGDALRSLGKITLNTERVSARNARVTALGTMRLNGKSSLALDGGRYASAAGVLVDAGDLETSATLRSENTVTLRARSGGIVNRGRIAGDKGAILRAAKNVRNHGEVSSATSIALDSAACASRYRLDGKLRNRNGDLLAERDLSIVGLGSARAGAIENISGVIEAVGGDLSLAAQTITNARDKLVVGNTSTTRVTQAGNTTTTTVTTRETIEDSSAAAKLLAGGALTVDAAMLTNSYSEIAANGDIRLRADQVDNRGRDLIETVEKTHVTKRRVRYCKHRILGGCVDHGHRTVTTRRFDSASSTYAAAFATIAAGGTLDAQVSGYLNNEAVREGAAQIGLASGSRALAAATVNGAAAPARVNLEPLALARDALFDRGALFRLSAAANAPFLLETRPQFIDPGKFLGSDFFLERVGGYHPEHTLRRFGDAYVETRLVRDQLFALGDHRTLGEASDVRARMRALYENAIDARKELALTIGLALTPAQIARLGKDIVWLEKQRVRGEEVLVPRVYLAAARAPHLDAASARIHATRADVHAALLRNSGTLATRDGLTITAEKAVLNRGGGLFAGSDLVVAGGALFADTSGTVSAQEVRIRAQDILNDSAKIRDRHDNGFSDREQQRARIEAGGDLRVEADATLAAAGGRFVSGGDMRLSGGKTVELGALALERLAEDTLSGGYNRDSALTHRLTTVDAGGRLDIHSGGDLTLRGVTTASGGDSALGGEGAVTIASVQDRERKDFKLDIETGGMFGVETNIREQSALLETQATRLTSGGKLTITAGKKDLTLTAAKLHSEDQTTLAAAQGTVALLSDSDIDYEQKKRREEDALWWNDSDKDHVHETIEHVEITAGGGLAIDAGEGIVIEYHKTGDLQASIDQLSASPGLEWLGTLKNDPRVDWTGVEAQFEEWNYHHQGLTEAGAVLVSIVVGVVSGGALSGLSAALAQGMGMAANGMAQAALQAGLNALASQASVALINNKGNVGAALKSLGSSASLRSLATAMVAAGLTTQLGATAGDLPKTAPLTARVSQDIQRGLMRATVRAGVSTAIQRGALDDNLVLALRQEAAAVIGENAAQEIGAAYHGGKLNKVAQLAAHAAVGCASGAFGGVAGEVTGEILERRIRARLDRELDDGEITREEAEALAEDLREEGVDIARLAAGLGAALGGGEVTTAADAGETAAKENAFWVPLIMLAGALWTAYDVATTYREEGGEGVLKQLALDGAITVATGGAGKIVYKVGGKVFKSAPKAFQAVKKAGLWRKGAKRGLKPKPGSVGGDGAKKPFSTKVKDQARAESKVKDQARAESNDTCVFCGTKTTRQPGPTRSEIDHSIPKSRGGNNNLENAQNTCRTCNRKKGAKTTEEFLDL